MRSIVYNDINKSTFSYNVDELEFYFSSEFNKSRFIKGYKNFIDEEIKKLENKYHVNIKFEIVLLIAYYKKIEKRGFKIKNTVNNRVYIDSNI